MKLRHLLRRLLPAELQALAEKIESLDPVGCDDDRAWLVMSAGAFLGRQNNDTLGLRWYERRIMMMEAAAKYRALSLHDAMALVMRVPSGEQEHNYTFHKYGPGASLQTAIGKSYAHNLARAMTSTKDQLSEKIVLRRKQESV
jgi:hypothetical protein